MKSVQKSNPYLQELMFKGTNTKFIADMNIIVDSIQFLNHNIFG
jgi:hypothetical protein